MQIPSDGVQIGCGTLAGGIIIWNPWSNKSDANLEDSARTVRVLLFFSIKIIEFLLGFSRILKN